MAGAQLRSSGHVHPTQRWLFHLGQGRFAPIDWTPPAEVPDEEYPLVLSTGRRLYQYHSRTQTGRCLGLNAILGEETADISLADAEEMGSNTAR